MHLYSRRIGLLAKVLTHHFAKKCEILSLFVLGQHRPRKNILRDVLTSGWRCESTKRRYIKHGLNEHLAVSKALFNLVFYDIRTYIYHYNEQKNPQNYIASLRIFLCIERIS